MVRLDSEKGRETELPALFFISISTVTMTPTDVLLLHWRMLFPWQPFMAPDIGREDVGLHRRVGLEWGRGCENMVMGKIYHRRREGKNKRINSSIARMRQARRR